MDVNALPEILEIKDALDGRRKEFRCRLLERTPRSAAVLFVSTVAYQVGALALPPGTVTFGHFWTDRPYNVYHWLTPQGTTMAFYFNLADRTAIDEQVLRWRDLAIDVLVRGTTIEVLDENELPAGLDRETRATVESAKRAVVNHAASITAELEARAGTLWTRAFGATRR